MVKLEDFEVLIHPQTKQTPAGTTPEYPVIITSLAGSTSGMLRLDVANAEFQTHLTRVSSIEPNVEIRKKFGEILFNALFTDVIRDRWNFSVGGAEGLRIRLDIQAPELAVLPWELMHQEDIGFLSTATNFVLSRYLRVLELPQQQIDDKVRVLLVAQSPQGLPEILAEEFDQLQQAIRDTGDMVELTVLENKPLSDMQQALEKQNYHILHFLGHGIGGSLALTDTNGQLHRIEDDQFAQLLQGRHSVKLVVLNACSSSQHDGNRLFSGVGPALVKKRLPAVVAMQYPAVHLSTAANFSQKFYAALANGYPIDLAVNQARNFLSAGDLLDGRDWSTPILYVGTRRGEMLFWSFNKKPLSVSTPLSMPKPELPHSLVEYVEIIQTIQQHVKGLQEWLELDNEYQRLQVTVNSFADQVKLFHQSLKQSDLAMQQLAIGQIDRAWQLCAKIIDELTWMSEQFNFILPEDEPLPDKRDFVSWISELSTLGSDIQGKIDEGDLSALASATTIFLKKLEQRSRGPLKVVRDEVKSINDLTIQAAAKIAAP